MKNIHRAAFTVIASLAMMLLHIETQSPFAFGSMIALWIATIAFLFAGDDKKNEKQYV